MVEISISVLTVSDRSFRKEREDLSGPLLIDKIETLGWRLIDYDIVPDEIKSIQEKLIVWSDSIKPNLIITTGGTGFSPRDLTPEATIKIITRNAPGLSEAMRASGIQTAPHAILSRGVTGIRNESIIVNLPGSPKGAIENLTAIENVLPHAVKLLLNRPEAENEHRS
jgi:molybdopterin adenylyltransferase